MALAMKKPWKIAREVNGCCSVAFHFGEDKGDAIFISLDSKFKDSPKIGYNCLMNAIGDVLIEAGIDITRP